MRISDWSSDVCSSDLPLGVVIALPAMRLQGLYLALVTFALAQVSRDVIFQDTRIYGLGGVKVGRLEIFGVDFVGDEAFAVRSEEHTSELQSLMRISYAVFCLKKKKNKKKSRDRTTIV